MLSSIFKHHLVLGKKLSAEEDATYEKMQRLYHDKCEELKIKPDRRVLKKLKKGILNCKKEQFPVTRRRGFSLSASKPILGPQQDEDEDNIKTDISTVSSSSTTTTSTSSSSNSFNKQIRKLSFKKLGLHDLQIQAISHMLSWHHLLDWTLVSFSKNLISDAVVSHLINMLSYFPSLSTLDLSYNKITEIGAKNLQKSILAHSNQCKLLLHHNEMKQDVHYSNSIVAKFMIQQQHQQQQQMNSLQQPFHEELDDISPSNSPVSTSATIVTSTHSSGANTPVRFSELSTRPQQSANNPIYLMNTSGETSQVDLTQEAMEQKQKYNFEVSPIVKEQMETIPLTTADNSTMLESTLSKNPFDSPSLFFENTAPVVEHTDESIPPHIIEQLELEEYNSKSAIPLKNEKEQQPCNDATLLEVYNSKREAYLQKDSKLKEYVTYTVDSSLKYNLHQQGLHTLNCNSFLHITYLDVSRNNISTIESVPHSVVYLDLSHNLLKTVTCFENTKQLKVLLLKDNCIQTISGLEECTQLEVLDLGGNQISKVINLETLTSLRILDLSYNQIRNKGALRLLSLNKCLESLFLKGNPIVFALDVLQRKQFATLTKVYVKNIVPSLLYYDGKSASFSIRKKEKVVKPKEKVQTVIKKSTHSTSVNSTVHSNNSSSLSEIASPRKLKRQIEESVTLNQILFDSPLENSSRALVYGSKPYWDVRNSANNTSMPTITASDSNTSTNTSFYFVIYINLLTLIRDFVKTVQMPEANSKEWESKWPVIDQTLQELDELQPQIVNSFGRKGDDIKFILQTFHSELKNSIFLLRSIHSVTKDEESSSENLSKQGIKQLCEECNIFDDNSSLWEIVPYHLHKDFMYALELISLCCNLCKKKVEELLVQI